MRVEYVVVSVPSLKGTPSEDAYLVDGEGGGKPFFAAIADGHGEEVDERGDHFERSQTVARFSGRLVGSLHERFVQFPDPTYLPDIFDVTAQDLDGEFRALTERQHLIASLRVGAVASCVTVVDGRIHLAQTGDCRFYAASDSPRGFIQLSRDHDCNHPDELARLQPILTQGKFVIWPPFLDESSPPVTRKRRLSYYVGENVVAGILPTRTFGDWRYHPAVIHTPEVNSFELAAVPEGTVFALCSDGGNRYVEHVLGPVAGHSHEIPLSALAEATKTRIDIPGDDVTIIYFRVYH